MTVELPVLGETELELSREFDEGRENILVYTDPPSIAADALNETPHVEAWFSENEEGPTDDYGPIRTQRVLTKLWVEGREYL